MSISCVKRCGFIRTLVNLRCPDCFEIEVDSETKDECDCKVTLHPDKLWGWE